MIDNKIPSSTVPIVKIKDDSIEQYELGSIQPEHHAVIEEKDVDPLRGVSLEDDSVMFIDNHDLARIDASNAIINNPEDTISTEAFSDVIRNAKDAVINILNTNQDRAFKLLQRARELEGSLLDYVQPSDKYKTALADRIHVNNVITTSNIINGAKRQLKLSEFIKTRYKDMLRHHLDTIIDAIKKHTRSDASERKLNFKNAQKTISEISRTVKEELSITLVDLIVGVADNRQLVGGYSLERAPEWKSKISNLLSFLPFKGMGAINVSNLIVFDKQSYNGDSIIAPITKNELKNLLKIVNELANFSTIKEEELTFTIGEYREIIRSIDTIMSNPEDGFLKSLDSYLAEKNKADAIKNQLTGMATFPLKVVARNIKAAEAILDLIAEAIHKSKGV